MDFRTAYYGGKCFLGSCDPYNVADTESLLAREIPPTAVPDPNRIVATKNIYLPSALPWTTLFALFQIRSSLVIWLILIAGSFVLASLMVWRATLPHAPMLVAMLLVFCLANSVSLLNSANPAGFVVPFCILATLSFLHDRFVRVGMVCFAVSLAFKPHDGGLIWLYFLLAGGLYRKRALQTLAVVAAFSVPAVLWVSHISPHWLQELSTNLAAFSGPGHMNDPRGEHGALMMTNLQTVTSFFWTDPRAYNFAAYLVCAPLLVAWGWITLRSRPTLSSAWFALAAISAFAVLPVYHRQYDAKLILLALPAFAILWSRRDRLAWIAFAVTATAFFFDGDFPWVVFLEFTRRLHLYPNGPYSAGMKALSDFPVPLSLLLMGTFYLCIYAKLVRNPGWLAEEKGLGTTPKD
ncbi:MAG: hypothetical protein WAN28_13015 [Terracidiphilus sp.]